MVIILTSRTIHCAARGGRQIFLLFKKNHLYTQIGTESKVLNNFEQAQIEMKSDDHCMFNPSSHLSSNV